MNSKFKQSLHYINWKEEATIINLTNEELKDKYDYLKQNGQKANSKTIRSDYDLNSYRVDKIGNYKRIYTYENGKYVIYSSNVFDNNKNDGRVNAETGTKAIQALSSKFNERTGLGVRCFYKAFGITESEFKRCIPKQFVYINFNYKNRILHNVSSIDGCSQYPSNMMGLLPDANTAVEYEGTVKPNEEYPFAFYLKSGHCAQYNLFDTHNWVKSPYIAFLFEKIPNCKPDDDKTILMKASQYNLDEEYKYFYSLRKTDETAKMVMNASIGMMHTKKYGAYKYAHLAAIAIARANDKHLKMLNKIGFNNVIHVCVDGIIYQSPVEYGEHKKQLGIYEQEFTNCDFVMRGANAYIAMKDNTVVKVKHGAFNFNEDGSVIDESKITSLLDINNWIRINPTEDVE